MTLVLKKPAFQRLNNELFETKKLTVFVLRDDQVHPFISGNKWRKLKYNVEEFRKGNFNYLVTFGGAFSNHIVATAAAGKELGINTIGIIRGDELTIDSSPVIHFAHQCGMKLIFVTREKYRTLREDYSLLLSALSAIGSSFFILPEGGSNDLAIKGCKEIVDDIPIDFDYICCASGTGTTLSGIIQSLKTDQQAIGISVLKNETLLNDIETKSVGSQNNFQLIHDYHFGGYGKSTTELENFCESFTKESDIPVEPIYTGKLFFGVLDLIKKDFFEAGKTIVVVHTGGIFTFQKK